MPDPPWAESDTARNEPRSRRTNRIECDLVEFTVVAIHQAYRHLLRAAVDVDDAEELQAGRRRQVLALFGGRRLHIFQLRAKGRVKVAGAERACMQRTGDEFP